MDKLSAYFYKGITKIVVKGLTQWDYGQKLYIAGLDVPPTLQVHFSNDEEKTAIVMQATLKDGVISVDVPNVLLEKTLDIKAWLYVLGQNSGETVRTIILPVEPRIKPADYVSENPQINKGYIVPATENSLGGIIVGDRLSITEEGRLSADSQFIEMTNEELMEIMR